MNKPAISAYKRFPFKIDNGCYLLKKGGEKNDNQSK